MEREKSEAKAGKAESGDPVWGCCLRSDVLEKGTKWPGDVNHLLLLCSSDVRMIGGPEPLTFGFRSINLPWFPGMFD